MEDFNKAADFLQAVDFLENAFINYNQFEGKFKDEDLEKICHFEKELNHFLQKNSPFTQVNKA